MKEILLYNSIYEYSTERFINEINDAGNGGIKVVINSRGGSPTAGWGMIAKLNDYKGKKSTFTHGRADSMAAFLLCYTEYNECLSVSEFLIHRAAYPKWIESNTEYFTEDRRADLERTNQHLRNGFEAKVNVTKFESITGVTLDDLFSMESRIDVTLTAQQAKEVGLINKIVSLTPEIKAEVESTKMLMAAEAFDLEFPKAEQPAPAQSKNNNQETTKNTTMTLAEFKANNPDLYDQIFKSGVTAERDRAGAYLVYADVDLEAVQAGIESGEPLSQKQSAEFARKAMSAQAIKQTEEENAEPIETGQPKKPQTEDEKGAEALNKYLDDEVGENK